VVQLTSNLLRATGSYMVFTQTEAEEGGFCSLVIEILLDDS